MKGWILVRVSFLSRLSFRRTRKGQGLAGPGIVRNLLNVNTSGASFVPAAKPAVYLIF